MVNQKNENVTSQVDFGFQEVPTAEKSELVGEVFSQVAPYYNRMNDIMSLGAHRYWKWVSALLTDVRQGMSVLDLATGSADMAALLAPQVGDQGKIVITDINAQMLALGQKKLLASQAVQCNAESLPFASCSFDRVVMAFGLRNVTNRERVLGEIKRVLKTGGRYLILEFSPEAIFPSLYEFYLLRVLPQLGHCFAADKQSYRYLGESILRFPNPQKLSEMLKEAGLSVDRMVPFAARAVFAHGGCSR